MYVLCSIYSLFCTFYEPFFRFSAHFMSHFSRFCTFYEDIFPISAHFSIFKCKNTTLTPAKGMYKASVSGSRYNLLWEGNGYFYTCIIPDIIQPPTAFASLISCHCSGSNLIPPMAKTGSSTLSQTCRKNSSPRGASPFLQSVV